MFEKIAEKLYEECCDKSKGIMDISIVLATEFDITQGTDSFAELVSLVREYRNGTRGLSDASFFISEIHSKPTSCDIPVGQCENLTEEEKLYIENNFDEPNEVFTLVRGLRKEGKKFALDQITSDCCAGVYYVEFKGNRNGNIAYFTEEIHVRPYDSYREQAIEQRVESLAQSWDCLYDIAEGEVECCGPFEVMGMSVILEEDESEDGYIVAAYN